MSITAQELPETGTPIPVKKPILNRIKRKRNL